MRNICTPALVYFIFSTILVIISIFNNFNWKIILFQLLCIFLWTWVLSVICNSGYSTISWILVLVPFASYLFNNV